MADSEAPIVKGSEDLEVLPPVVKSEVEPEVEPEPVVEPEAESKRESDPERVAKGVESAAVEVRDEGILYGIEGDVVQPWALGSSNASTLTHVSAELAPNLTESAKALRRKLN